MNKRINGTAWLIGTIIGAGILSIPNIIGSYNVLIVIVSAILAIFILVDISNIIEEKTREKQTQISEIVKREFKERGKKISYYLLMIEGISALMVYFAFSYEFLGLIGISIVIMINLIATLSNMKLAKELELTITLVMILTLAAAIILRLPTVKLPTFMKNSGNFLHLTAIWLFTLGGIFAVPEALESTKDRKERRKIIISAYIISFLLALMFGLVYNTSENGLIIQQIEKKTEKILIIIFAITAVYSSNLAISRAMVDLMHENKKSKSYQLLMLNFPLFIVFLPKKNIFISTIGFAGALGVGAVGLILLELKQSKWKRIEQLFLVILLVEETIQLFTIT